ncbi:T3SS effector HopA1 family protein [Staphylococcus epidermidis]
MTVKSNSIDNLEKIIKLKADLDRIELNGLYYTGVLERPKNELIQWLYSNLHTGHIMFDEERHNSIKNLNDLNEQIITSVEDPGVSIKSQNQMVNGNNYALIHGVRVTEKSDEYNSVVLPCFRPNLTPGFFMFVHTENGIHSSPIKRHYIYADTPSYAIHLWSQCVKELVDKNINFSAKVLSSSNSYPRNDALVFYSSKDYLKVEEILNKNVQKNPRKSDFNSILAKKISENLYTAEEPYMTNEIKQSFGEHRCNAIADAIQDHFITSVNFKLLLKQRLISYSINPEDLSENFSE